ncbi:MAG: trehalose-6-phosphate synthase, partial [Anaerolineales bacterium]|nr:trehalose-6-phosphate synthase [Anaerolineales bacterium]
LPGAHVNYREGRVWYRNHATHVRDFPISIDVAGLRDVAEGVEVESYRSQLLDLHGEWQIVLRIDRIEPSKNIVRGFQAFDELLERYPEHRGKATFLAPLVPSRLGLGEYGNYLDEVMSAAGRVNAKYGGSDWEPIRVLMDENYPRAVAGLQIYDALLVNSIADGMNLVAKEGPIVNERNGVLVLSEAVGAHEQLKEGVLTITPVDTENTAQKLYEALSLSAEDRKRRSDILRKTIRRDDLDNWLRQQLADVSQLLLQQAAPKAAQLALLHL